jgi:hypothetical protein
MAQHNAVEAIKDFTTAISIKASLAQAYAWRGYALILNNDAAGAEIDFGRAIAISPALQPEIEANKKALSKR